MFSSYDYSPYKMSNDALHASMRSGAGAHGSRKWSTGRDEVAYATLGTQTGIPWKARTGSSGR